MHSSYRFGRCELDPNRRQLLIDGSPAALGGRAFDVLLALVERRDQLVTKDELLELAWPGLVVEENNLQVQISSLRKVLGPQVIATIPGRGYRFAAPVDGAGDRGPDAAIQGAARATKDAGAERRPLTNLPRDLQPLYGREADRAALRALIDQHRLVKDAVRERSDTGELHSLSIKTSMPG